MVAPFRPPHGRAKRSGLRFICFRRGFEVTIRVTVNGRPSVPLDVQVPQQPFERVADDLPRGFADGVEHEK